IAPLLVQAQGVNLELDGASVFSTAQFTSFLNGRMQLGGDVEYVFGNLLDATETDFVLQRATGRFPLLRNLNHGGVTLSQGGHFDAPLIDQLDGAAFEVADGAVLSFPSVESYDLASRYNGDTRQWIVRGDGSRLELPNLSSIKGGDHYASRLLVTAWAGGQIDLSSVASIRDSAVGDTRQRSIELTTEGMGGLLDLSSLTEFTDRNGGGSGDDRSSVLEARYGAEARLAAAATVTMQGVRVTTGVDGAVRGSLQLLDKASLIGGGTIVGSVSVAGPVAPAGRLTITGDFAQQATSRMQFDIGGPVPVAQHDVLTIGGRATFGGTVKLVRTNNYVPADGESVRTIEFGSRTPYEPTFEGLDFGGNSLAIPEWSLTSLVFSFGFATGPSVVSLTPSDSSSSATFSDVPFVDVVFSEPIDPTTFTAADIQAYAPGGAAVEVSAPVALDASSTRFRIKVARSGFVNGSYHFVVGPNVADFVGNYMNQNGDAMNGEPQDAFSGIVTLRAPDLAVADVMTAPAVADFGSTIEVSYTVRNVGPVAAAGSWVDRVYLSTDDVVDASDVLLGTLQSSAALSVGAGADYDRSINVTLPLRSTLLPGDYRILVVADEARALADTNAANNLNGATVALRVPIAPDLAVQQVSGPVRVAAGQQVDVAWTIRNQGAAPTSGSWYDALYLAKDGDIRGLAPLATVSRTASLAIDQSYATGARVTVPAVIDGDYRWVVVTDAGESIYEGPVQANNTRASSSAVAVVHADLRPASVVAPNRADSGDSFTVSWQVANIGSESTLAGWSDRVYLSTNGTLDGGDRLLATVTRDESLAPGATTDRSALVEIPADANGSYFLIVATDDPNRIVEPNAESNNTATRVVTVDLSPYADLIVTRVAAPTQVIGDPARMTVSWTVTNRGLAAGRTSSWNDAIVASSDSILGNGDDVLLGRFPHTGSLAVNSSYSREESITLPPNLTGSFRLFARADVDEVVFENYLETNNGLAAPAALNVMPIPYADLVVTGIEPQAGAASGQPLTISYTVANQGIGLTSVGAWSDYVYLARDAAGQDPIAGAADWFVHFGHVAVGDGYERFATVSIPDGISGAIYAVVTTAAANGPFEFTHADNNRRVSAPITVTLSPSPDLRVTSATGPVTARESDPIDVTWTVLNDGEALADGAWIDSIYLENVSTQERIGLGQFRSTKTLQPGLGYTRTEQLRLPAHLQGVFRVMVATNATEELYEGAGRSNNTRAATSLLTVSVLPRPDLRVESVQAPARFIPGGLVSVGFTVANRGTGPTLANWTDSVYLSLDNRLSQDDLLIGSMGNVSALAVNDAPYRTDTPSTRIPERYRGDLFFLILPDSDRTLDEWPNEENNLLAVPTYAEPLPLPDLVVSEVLAPNQVVAGATVDVGYTVTNRGSGATLVDTWTETVWLTRDRDRPHPGLGDLLLTSITHSDPGRRLSRNAGYDVTTSVRIPDGIEPGNWFITPWVDPYDAAIEDTLSSNINPDDPNQFDNNNYKARPISVLVTKPDLEVTSISADAIGTGGESFHLSYRVENRGNATSPPGFADRVYLSTDADPFAPQAKSMLLATITRPLSLGVLESYTQDLHIDLPPSASGRHIVVVTDTFSQVDEASDSNNSLASDTDVRPVPADLVVTGVTFEQDNLSGESTVLRYTVKNIGDYPVWSGTNYWKDFIWVSPDPVFNRMRSSYLGEVVTLHDRPIAPGDSYEVVFRATWPRGVDGDYYVHIHLDAHNDNDPYFNPYNSRILLPEGWPADTGEAAGWVDYFHRWSFEDPSNNLYSARVPITYREPDLRVTDLQVPATLESGALASITYTATNRGTRDTRSDGWTDRLFLSLDPSLDAGDLELGSASRSGVLKVGESYTNTVDVTLPRGISGTFYLLAYVDAAATADPYVPSTIGFNQIGVSFEVGSPLAPWDLASASARNLARGRVQEYQDEGNNITVRELPVTLAAAPDLRVTAVQTPARAIRGQTLELTYTVSNRGAGDVPEGQTEWRDLVYLSRDPNLDLRADRYLMEVPHQGGLAAGESYTRRVTVQLPNDLLGSWYVIPVADPVLIGKIGEVFENDREKNEKAGPAVVIELPPPSDLRVQSVTGPAEVRVGEMFDVKWTVANSSREPATGSWFDSVYLSADGVWDVNDKLLGRVGYSGNLLPGQSYDAVFHARMPAVTPGNFRLIVRADIFNQVYEDQGDANNITPSLDTVRVRPSSSGGTTQALVNDVAALEALDEQLQLGVAAQTTLAAGQDRLFVVSAPVDQTLRVRVSGGGLDAVHELYVRHDEAPSVNEFDATSDVQLGSDLSAVIPSTKPGLYYILVRGRTEPAGDTPVTLVAELAPLAITDVKTDVGGDAKYVTTTIRGARFNESATIKLIRPGFAEFTPVSWRVLDATTIKATFDFTGAPHGLYDLQVTNPDGSSAVVPYRFLVEQAIEPDVAIGLGGPRIILAGETGLYSVALQSLSNVDTPYTFVQVGVPEMGKNSYVYDLPYVYFSSNVGGRISSNGLGDVPWDDLDPAVDTNGQLLAPGYFLDLPADGFTGLTFTATTYPGLKELNDRIWDELKGKLYQILPDLKKTGALDDGPQGLASISPSLSLAWQALGGAPDLLTKPFVPFQFNVTAAATALTRDEFIAQVTTEAERIRQGILADAAAPPALLVTAAKADTWRDVYLQALEAAGLLRSADAPPPITDRVPLYSLMATLGAGLLGGPAGDSLRDQDLSSLLAKLRKWYGHDSSLLA
ncbi:MAG TPA: CARDB domain-containing protein, partial [Pirellulaceae bacterium]|nr:CARDB domain-containing protein [Pirellulaceae bacterium]